jgi:hypothetical protein
MGSGFIENAAICALMSTRPSSASISQTTNARASVDARVTAAELLQRLYERRVAGLSFRILRGRVHENADAPHPLDLLRARRERPRCRCASEKRDEIAALHAGHGLPPAQE